MPLVWRNRLLWVTSTIVFIIIIKQPKTTSAEDDSRDRTINTGFSTTYWTTTLSTDFTTQPPITIDCPTNVTWPVLKGQIGANVNWTEPMVVESSAEGDIESDEISVVRPSRGPGSYFSVADNTVVQYLFLYKDTPPVVCEFPILFTVIEDTEDPEVICPENVTQSVPFGHTIAFVSWSNPTATDNSGVVTLLEASHSQDIPFPVGATNVTYTFVDPSGRVNSCTFFVVIEVLDRDDTPPEILFCPNDIMLKALSSEGGANVTWRLPEASDDSDSNVTLTSDVPNPGSFFEFGMTAIGYIFRDTSNNFNSCVFRISVIQVPDEENPCRSSPCQLGNCTLDFSEQGYRCACDVGFHGNDCGSCLTGKLQGCQQRTLITDATGERTNVSFQNPSASFDLINGDVPLDPSINIADGFTVGLTKFSYRAGCLKCVTSVIIEDKTPPNVTTCPNNIVDFLQEDELIKAIDWTEPTVSDYQENPPSNTSTHLPGDFFGQGITRVTYNFTDDACNWAVCSFTIQLTTISPLTIRNCPVNGIQARLPTGNDSVSVRWEEIDFANTSEFTVNSTHSPGDEFKLGNTQVNYTAIDVFGNVAECIFNVTVIEDDIESVKFVNCSGPITAVAPEDNDFVHNVSWVGPTLIRTDGSSSPIHVFSTHYPPHSFRIGDTTVTYTALNIQTEEMAICSFTVTVLDEHAPVFLNCPSRRRVQSCRGTTTAVWEPPTAIDNSLTEVDVDQITEAIPGQTRFRIGSTLVTYIATDEFQNLAVCSFFVDVHDEECSPIPRVVFPSVAGFFLQLFLIYLLGSSVFRCRRCLRRRKLRKLERAEPVGVVEGDRVIEADPSTTNEDDDESTSETDEDFFDPIELL